jgi:CO/xanthine dehydrogenase FAD-binding subunit
VRAREAESMLDSHRLDEVNVDEVAEAAVNATRPISDHRASAEYRHEMSRVLVKRAILDAYSKAEAMR